MWAIHFIITPNLSGFILLPFSPSQNHAPFLLSNLIHFLSPKSTLNHTTNDPDTGQATLTILRKGASCGLIQTPKL